ncbi:hypothetical protein N7522_001409 [Penicillium canescens]|nr:hypothetical protein N7522_001409 [Penicillium canescens]
MVDTNPKGLRIPSSILRECTIDKAWLESCTLQNCVVLNVQGAHSTRLRNSLNLDIDFAKRNKARESVVLEWNPEYTEAPTEKLPTN